MDCTFGTVGDDPSQVHPLDGRPFPSSGHVLPMCVFFFFQAEDGIRDGTVTGVQTCALPISSEPASRVPERRNASSHRLDAIPLAISYGRLVPRYGDCSLCHLLPRLRPGPELS